MTIENPYLMFLGDAADQLAAKVANGTRIWRPDWCIGQFRLPGCGADLGLPDMTMEEAAAAGVRTIIVGVANRGGIIPDSWVAELKRGLELGMNIASGLHNKVAEIPELVEIAKANGLRLDDVRHPTRSFSVANGIKRPGKRLLTVGTDCSVGKMFTSLAIEKEMRERGLKTSFRATGQTGIFIVGDGVSVDAVVADFISGATEWLTPANDPDHWDVVEGQGSLFHASYAGVTMGLIHGAQPDVLVVCHEAGRPHMRGLPDYELPPIPETIDFNLQAARLTNPQVRCAGVAVNTSHVSDADGEAFCRRVTEETGLPCVDTMKHGVGAIVDRIQAEEL